MKAKRQEARAALQMCVNVVGWAADELLTAAGATSDPRLVRAFARTLRVIADELRRLL